MLKVKVNMVTIKQVTSHEECVTHLRAKTVTCGVPQLYDRLKVRPDVTRITSRKRHEGAYGHDASSWPRNEVPSLHMLSAVRKTDQ